MTHLTDVLHWQHSLHASLMRASVCLSVPLAHNHIIIIIALSIRMMACSIQLFTLANAICIVCDQIAALKRESVQLLVPFPLAAP